MKRLLLTAGLALQDNPAASAATLRLAVYFSTQRPRTLAHLRATARTLLPPAFQAVIRNQGSDLDHLPERQP